ncbi:hypothetical protein QAD02_006780 [Eretmocerus hayati]|uniref:Uncharacterized protein n=1 Tax=Eretmocerus hayati TaxID=131215 RepID=A0ACC2N2Z0_9HYME|nr:hypothetical protein QAD02_006780 [Eretmocerus hayati]
MEAVTRILLFGVVAVFAKQHTLPGLEDLVESDIHDQCLAENNVTHDAKGFQKSCVIACSLEKVGWITPDGTVDKTVLKEVLSDPVLLDIYQEPSKIIPRLVKYCEKIAGIRAVYKGGKRSCRLVQCLEEEIFSKENDPILPVTEGFQNSCVVACSLEKIGWITPDGTANRTVLKEALSDSGQVGTYQELFKIIPKLVEDCEKTTDIPVADKEEKRSCRLVQCVGDKLVEENVFKDLILPGN